MQQVLKISTAHLHIWFPSRLQCIREDRWVKRGLLWPWDMWRMRPRVRTNIWEVKVSQLKSFQPDELAGDFSPWYFVSPSSTMYPRWFGCRMWWEVGVRWLADDGGRWGERSKFFVNKSKHQPKNKLAMNISPYFFVLRQPSMYTLGRGGRIGWRLAVGKVAVDAMMEGRGNTRWVHILWSLKL
jgi:hypothetical protein